MGLTISKSFSAVGNGDTITVDPNETISYSLSGTFTATVKLVSSTNNGQSWNIETSKTAAANGEWRNKTNGPVLLRWICTARSSGTAVARLTSPKELVQGIGQAAQPTSGSVAATIERMGKFFSLSLTLAAARVPVTDGAGSGSYGTLKIFDFDEGAVWLGSCVQNYTHFVEGADLTGGAGDAAFVIGLGSTAVGAAQNGTLAGTATDTDMGPQTGTITLSGGTGAGSKVSSVAAIFDGTSTASDINLNWSGTAATIDASSSVDVTGTITIVGWLAGDK